MVTVSGETLTSSTNRSSRVAETGVKGSYCPDEEEELKQDQCHGYICKHYTNRKKCMKVMLIIKEKFCVNV